MSLEELQATVRAAATRLRGELARARASRADTPLPEDLAGEFDLAMASLDAAVQAIGDKDQHLTGLREQMESERQYYRGLFAEAPCGYLTTDPNAIIRDVNDEVARQLDMRRDFLLGKPLVLYVAQKHRRLLFGLVAQVRQAKGNRALEQELVFLPRRSPPFPAAVTLSADRDSEGNVCEVRWTLTDISEQRRRQAVLETIRDELELRVADRTAQLTSVNTALQAEMAERRQAEASLRVRTTSLRALTGHLQSVREQESEKIAREVHDELGGSLTALRLGLATLLESLDGAHRERIQSLLALTEQSLQAVKRIATSLRPGMLDALGLVATIEWHVGEFSKLTGIACEMQLPEYIRLSRERGTAVFRVLQEALTNVARHAQAKRVRIEGRKQDGLLVVQIADDGIGITEADLTKPLSYGVLGMRERSDYLGGSLSIHSIPGGGTQVELRLPIDFEER